MSGFITNWTEFCCQPLSVRNTRAVMLSVIGIVGIIGTVCNIITISTFLYLYFFPQRIRKQFGQEFAMIKDPVFFLILHLSFCDLLYCIIGLPSYWSVYYYGYYPYSEAMCKYSAFFRNTLAYADFNTLSLISAYFAWRRGRGRPRNGRYGRWPVLGIILWIWIFSFCLTSIPLFEVCGKIGYDAVHGKCHIIECEKCSEDSSFLFPPGGVILAIGVGLPFITVLVSYGLVYRTLSLETTDAETWSQRRSVMILTSCYFIFLLPIGIIEWLPGSVTSRAFISVVVYCWYWFVYVVNFFIYIIFWRRIRKGIALMVKDVLGIAGWKMKTKSDSAVHSVPWWIELRRAEH
eukprot:GFUD01013101.1.p1 GENE.GFUD01013101.1~~GFUD01013101.1.p1  ORF type:complete len:379 (-),score=55.89 GFUD01013101.1:514-1557(-)